MKCPIHLIPTITAFNINGGYDCLIDPLTGTRQLTKPNAPSLKIDSKGNLNKEAQKKYELFLKLWFKHGKDFILRLKAKAIMLKVA